MKDKIIRNWYYLSVYAAGIVAMILCIGGWDLRIRMILGSTVFIFLHFFEEFAFPGGFPSVGMAAELKITDQDAENWPLNEVNSMFGNWWYAAVVYLLPLALPNVRFLTLAVALFAFVETIGHLVFFPISLKRLYNPGLFTAVCGLLPISIYYLVHEAASYSLADVVIALIWIVLNYWIAFRSPIYKKLGRLNYKYAFTDAEVQRGLKYLKNM